MFMRGLALKRDRDQQSAPVEGLGVGQSVGVLQQPCQVAELYGEVGVVRAEALLTDGQSQSQERLDSSELVA